MHDVLTVETKSQTRRIDRVTVKGSIEPIGKNHIKKYFFKLIYKDLYTCDVDVINLMNKIEIGDGDIDTLIKSNLTKHEKKRLKLKMRKKRNDLKNKALANNPQVSVFKEYFVKDREILFMRETFTKVNFILLKIYAIIFIFLCLDIFLNFKEFFENFNEGFENYLNGDWKKAEILLQEMHVIN